jgi:hypothetical protein
MPRTWSFSLHAVLAVLLLSACDNPVDPMTRVSGDYRATTFSATFGSTPVNLLAAGVELEINLLANGTTTGRFFVPAELNDDGDGAYTADLQGTWALNGDTVKFNHSADTLIRDMEFRVEGSRLVGEEDFGGGSVRVVLEK